MNPRINAHEWFDVRVEIADEHSTLAITIDPNPRLTLGSPRLEFAGRILASETVRGKNGALSVEAHDIPPCALIVPVRANVPIDERETTLRVSLDARTAEIPIELDGAPAFIASRCRWKTPKSIEPLRPTRVTLRLRNDGTAAARDLTIRIPIRAGLHLSCEEAVTSGEGGTPAFAVFVDRLDVGAHYDLELDVTVLDPSMESCALVAEVYGDSAHARVEAAFPVAKVAPPSIELSSPPYAVVVGETIPLEICIVNGPFRAETATVRIAGEGIAPKERLLRGLEPLETRRFVLATELTSAGSGTWEQRIVATLEAGESVAQSTSTVTGFGASRLTLRASHERLADGLTHRVGVSIDNEGLGVADDVAFDIEPLEGVFAVTDTLAIDGLPVFRVDGSVPVFERVGLGAIDIYSGRSLSFGLRSDRDQAVVLVLHARVCGDIVATTTLEVPFADASARATALETMAATAAASRATAPQEVHERDEEVARAATEYEPALEPEPEPAPEPEPEPEPEPQVRYRSESGEFVRMFIPSLNVPLGQIVLGLLEMIPTVLCGRADDPDLIELRTEIRALQSRYAISVENGNFGVSGYNVTPPALVRALAPVRAKLKYAPLVDAETTTVILGLLEIIDGEGEFGERVRSLRDRVAAIVRTITDEEMFLDVHPLIEVAA